MDGGKVMATTQGLKAYQEGRRDIFMIDPRVILIEPGFNVRDFEAPENVAHVEWLKGSILEVGMKEPITVRNGPHGPILVGGECRLRAIRALIEEGHDYQSIPCQADERTTKEPERVAELHVRNSGKRLAPIEVARIALRLTSNYGWDRAKVALHLRMSESNVSHLLALLEMPEEVQDMVKRGEVAASTALQTIKVNGEDAGATILREARTDAESAVPPRINLAAQVAMLGADSLLPPEKPAKVGRGVRVTPKRIKATTEKRQPAGKKAGKTLSVVQTEKVVAFLTWLLATAEDLEEVERKADVLMNEILQ
jgi:ParB family transcriptional regulator, chromosome partitioning protein